MDKSEKPPKPEQVLVIQPSNELEFVGPFNRPVTQLMTLTNPTEQRVCFKIKTTAPKKYCVKPNSGIIEPEGTVRISVGLQPFDYDASERNKHKFMVQSMYAPSGNFNLEDLWKEASGNTLMDSKLKCLFTFPSEPDSLSSFEKHDHSAYAKMVYSTAVNNFLNKKPKTDEDKPNELELKMSVDEIKKLQEEISSLRQDNIRIKEEAMRQRRLASNTEAESSTPSSYVIRSECPEQNSLTTTYVYLALIMFLIGFIIGKWII